MALPGKFLENLIIDQEKAVFFQWLLRFLCLTCEIGEEQ